MGEHSHDWLYLHSEYTSFGENYRIMMCVNCLANGIDFGGGIVETSKRMEG